MKSLLQPWQFLLLILAGWINTCYLLFVMELATRRVLFAGYTPREKREKREKIPVQIGETMEWAWELSLLSVIQPGHNYYRFGHSSATIMTRLEQCWKR